MTDTIGERIAKARRRKGLARQQDLADLVTGGRAATISDWETGASVPSYEKLVELVEALDCDGHWLLTGEGDPDRHRRTPEAKEAFADEVIDLLNRLQASDE